MSVRHDYASITANLVGSASIATCRIVLGDLEQVHMKLCVCKHVSIVYGCAKALPAISTCVKNDWCMDDSAGQWTCYRNIDRGFNCGYISRRSASRNIASDERTDR